jgi:hypothetical protein
MADLKTRFGGVDHIPTPELWEQIIRREPGHEIPGPKRPSRLVVIVVALAIAGAGAGLAVRSLQPSGPSHRHPASALTIANGVIAYAPIAEQGLFWSIPPTGGRATPVHVDVPGFVGVPSWSPDGTKIAFSVQSYEGSHPEGGNWDIYSANADGTSPVRLTRDKVDHSPTLSPDGTKIAYVHGWNDQQIWVMNADGSDADQLTQGSGSYTLPSWSPDGRQIAFVGWVGTNSEIYVMNADGSDVRRLTDDPAHDDAPAWSPTGRQIAFTSEGGERKPGVYAVPASGGTLTELVQDPDPANLGIAWSPDASKLALVGIRGPGTQRNVYLYDVATRVLSAIGTPGAYYGVSWQPLQAAGASPKPSTPTTSESPSPRSPTPPPVATAGYIGGMDAVAFADGLHGWAAGDGILATADGGRTWTRQYSGHPGIVALDALDAADVWAVGKGSLLRTTDGGHTWTDLGERPGAR